MVNVLDDLALAHRIADEADALTLARFRASDLRIDHKADHSEVTDADLAVEDAARRIVAAARPGDAVHGEERADTGSGPRRWIIDPIDGTANYARGVPVWATLIALAEGDEVVASVVSAPALHRRWWA
ncbi:MAG: inositol monophosphatase family protein, partial [Cutibacterium granulosum]|nr:inositol monophosphatase family protein [Cutibacterium granulosum]